SISINSPVIHLYMFLKLLRLEWKSFFRSANVGKGLAVKFFLGFLGIYFLAIFILLGFGLYFAIQELYPNEEPILFVNNFLLLWLLFEFMLRFVLQNLPVINAKSLLTQRVARQKIVHVLLAKSLFSFYNLLTLVTAVPFISICIVNTDYSI